MGFEKWVMYVRKSLTTNECILGMNVGWMDGRMDGWRYFAHPPGSTRHCLCVLHLCSHTRAKRVIGGLAEFRGLTRLVLIVCLFCCCWMVGSIWHSGFVAHVTSSFGSADSLGLWQLHIVYFAYIWQTTVNHTRPGCVVGGGGWLTGWLGT